MPEDARADLAAALLESLDEPTDEDVEAAWADEIARRIRRDEMRRRLGQRRQAERKRHKAG